MIERVTLITGASAGIGAELARVFASHGHRLALVARRADRLAVLAARNRVAPGGAAPIVISCDLEQPDACDKIATALADAGSRSSSVVNNAGFGMFGTAVGAGPRRAARHDRRQIRALTDLSLRFPEHLIRHRGGILNLELHRRLPAGARHGGISRLQGLCTVLHRSVARRARATRRAVHRAVSRPGALGIPDAGRVLPGLDFAVLNVSASDVARGRYQGLMANKRAVLPGLGIKIVPVLLRLFPRGFILAAVARFQLRKRG